MSHCTLEVSRVSCVKAQSQAIFSAAVFPGSDLGENRLWRCFLEGEAGIQRDIEKIPPDDPAPTSCLSFVPRARGQPKKGKEASLPQVALICFRSSFCPRGPQAPHTCWVPLFLRLGALASFHSPSFSIHALSQGAASCLLAGYHLDEAAAGCTQQALLPPPPSSGKVVVKEDGVFRRKAQLFESLRQIGQFGGSGFLLTKVEVEGRRLGEGMFCLVDLIHA